jgi:hypothetical protein
MEGAGQGGGGGGGPSGGNGGGADGAGGAASALQSGAAGQLPTLERTFNLMQGVQGNCILVRRCYSTLPGCASGRTLDTLCLRRAPGEPPPGGQPRAAPRAQRALAGARAASSLARRTAALMPHACLPARPPRCSLRTSCRTISWVTAQRRSTSACATTCCTPSTSSCASASCRKGKFLARLACAARCS